MFLKLWIENNLFFIDIFFSIFQLTQKPMRMKRKDTSTTMVIKTLIKIRINWMTRQHLPMKKDPPNHRMVKYRFHWCAPKTYRYSKASKDQRFKFQCHYFSTNIIWIISEKYQAVSRIFFECLTKKSRM